ncbi:MAG: protein-L-isoaspartate(D-aspartate) O-methyltransferase, partial [Planctomycetaceae bacterium]|nr:protein-L-isoaspartate(D-aspartate) O-methyltransferase [Planctomycetaceae bacterium]
GGRMIIPLGERYQQVFHLFEKKNGQLVRTKLLPTLFVPMTGQMEELRDKLPDGGNPQFANGSFEVDDNGDDLADGWHYQRRSTLSDDALEGKVALMFENTEPGRGAHVLQGMAIDGTKVSQIRVGWGIKSDNIRRGRTSTEVPGMVIYFFDQQRIPFDRITVGPWLADEPEWKRSSVVIDVPKGAREAIVQIGLNGATGTLSLGDLSLVPVR